jgi:sulfoxide reductase catalytic subunit YedY
VGLYGETLPIRTVRHFDSCARGSTGFQGDQIDREGPLFAKQPVSSWQINWPQAYGFYANVNPAVAHPRHTQAVEARLPSLFQTTKTLPFNGYADQWRVCTREWIFSAITDPFHGPP